LSGPASSRTAELAAPRALARLSAVAAFIPPMLWEHLTNPVSLKDRRFHCRAEPKLGDPRGPLARHYRATLGGTWYRYSFRYSISAPRSSMATRMRSRIDSMDRRRSPLMTGMWRMLA